VDRDNERQPGTLALRRQSAVRFRLSGHVIPAADGYLIRESSIFIMLFFIAQSIVVLITSEPQQPKVQRFRHANAVLRGDRTTFSVKQWESRGLA
jgi:hypothetical protein